MNFQEGNIYHIYNRGNNQQKIFFTHDNYLYFLRKVRKYILPKCDILSYCLMPNHFHLMIFANKKTIQTQIVNGQERNTLSEGIRVLLSTYTQGINKQEKRKGSLFSQNTKAKSVMDEFYNYYYPEVCFYYIHQNPFKARLVANLEDWAYSSFLDYTGKRNGTLCNISLAKQLMDLDWEKLHDLTNEKHLKKEDLQKIF